MKFYEKTKLAIGRALFPLVLSCTVCLIFFFAGLTFGAGYQRAVDRPFLEECVKEQKRVKETLREIKDIQHADGCGMRDDDRCTILCYGLDDRTDGGIHLTGAWGWKDPDQSSCSCFFTPEIPP